MQDGELVRLAKFCHLEWDPAVDREIFVKQLEQFLPSTLPLNALFMPVVCPDRVLYALFLGLVRFTQGI